MDSKHLPDGRLFKIHASQASKILGTIGLTDKQYADYIYLRDRPKGRTDLQEITYSNYLAEMTKPKHLSLPQTCKTHLHEWYAADTDRLFSKEINKGNAVELDVIELACEALSLGVAEKNRETKEDEYFIGTCDVDAAVINAIIDAKAPWNCTTFHRNTEGMDAGYKTQGKIYCHLWKREKFILFYGLVDTPADVNFDQEVIFSDRPAGERWIAYQTKADPELIKQIEERVELCRDYLLEYDKKIRATVGRLIEVE